MSSVLNAAGRKTTTKTAGGGRRRRRSSELYDLLPVTRATCYISCQDFATTACADRQDSVNRQRPSARRSLVYKNCIRRALNRSAQPGLLAAQVQTRATRALAFTVFAESHNKLYRGINALMSDRSQIKYPYFYDRPLTLIAHLGMTLRCRAVFGAKFLIYIASG